MNNPIAESGHPLAFLCAGGGRPALLGGGQGRANYTVEARMLSGHQKEAVVHEGEGGQAWRMVSDEGRHLKGHDVAPFPLGFFNAGIQGDLMARLAAFASGGGEDVRDAVANLRNYYWFEGSFADGSGKGQSESSELRIDAGSPTLDTLVRKSLRASPAIDALHSVQMATFALYVNGQRVRMTTVPASASPDAADPFLVHSRPPAPLCTGALDPISQSGTVQAGSPEPFPDTVKGRRMWRVAGRSAYAVNGAVESETWLERPGTSHFTFLSDDRHERNVAPSGLAYLSAGIAFCFMTQLSRYMMAMKLETGRLRLVQRCPFEVDAIGRGIAHPVDTHLFLNGRANPETHEMLVRIAANTCYLHAALKSPLMASVSLSGEDSVASTALVASQ